MWAVLRPFPSKREGGRFPLLRFDETQIFLKAWSHSLECSQLKVRVFLLIDKCKPFPTSISLTSQWFEWCQSIKIKGVDTVKKIYGENKNPEKRYEEEENLDKITENWLRQSYLNLFKVTFMVMGLNWNFPSFQGPIQKNGAQNLKSLTWNYLHMTLDSRSAKSMLIVRMFCWWLSL